MLEQSLAKVATVSMLATPSSLRRRYDIEVTTVGGITVISTPLSAAGFWCRAVGFQEPPSADLIEEIVAHFRDRGVRRAEFVLPRFETGDVEPIVAKHGMTLGSRVIAYSGRPPLSPPDAAATLRTGRVDPPSFERCATLTWEAFGLATEPHVALSTAALADPRFQAWACWDGTEMVAAALAYRDAEETHLVSGAVHPGYRGRGLQSALIAARVRDAEAAGSRLLITEAYAGGSSARNVVRAGFTPQYERLTWVWTA